MSNVKRPKNAEKEPNKIENLLIIGAGMGAKEIILAVNNTMKDKYNIVGMIDDNKNKLNKYFFTNNGFTGAPYGAAVPYQ